MRGTLLWAAGFILAWPITLLAGTPPPMAAAGLLVKNGKSTCSSVLIAPDLVATAAHCVAWDNIHDPENPDVIMFRTGSYPGFPATEYKVAKIMTHPLYRAKRDSRLETHGADVALLKLTTQVAETLATPIPLGGPSIQGERPFVVSWPGARGDRARERICPVVNATRTVAYLSCIVAGGESGSPVIRRTASGFELAAIVVATTRMGHQPFAVSAQAKARVRQLLAIHQP